MIKKIKFETSIGWFECFVSKNDEVMLYKEEDYWKLKKLISFWKIKILNEQWITIELTDPYYGTPEYKYEVIENQ